MTNTYDDNVNWVSLRLYGTNNELVLSKKLNYAIFLIEYDENNREIAEKYFDTNGNPTMNTIGYSSYKIEYDDYGVPTTNYYDEKGLVRHINADQPIEQVWQDVQAALEME